MPTHIPRLTEIWAGLVNSTLGQSKRDSMPRAVRLPADPSAPSAALSELLSPRHELTELAKDINTIDDSHDTTGSKPKQVEAAPSPQSATSKRLRSDSQQELQEHRKKSRTSEHELRLTGDYGPGSDPTPIDFPQNNRSYDLDKDWPPMGGQVQVPARRPPGIQPMNTLNASRPFARYGRPINTQSKLVVTSSRGSNIPATRGESSSTRSLKRRKMSDDRIDLTTEDDGDVLSPNSKGLVPGSTMADPAQKPLANKHKTISMFGNREARSVDAMVRPQAHPPRIRRDRVSVDGSQRTSAASSSPKPRETSADANAADDSRREAISPVRSTTSRIFAEHKAPSRMPINLDDGVHDEKVISLEKEQRGRMASGAYKTAEVHVHSRPTRSVHPTELDSGNHGVPIQIHDDSHSTATGHPKVRERMQDQSRRQQRIQFPPNDAGEDELALGAPTVGSHRHVQSLNPPYKNPAPGTQRRSAVAAVNRDASPSDLRPTPFMKPTLATVAVPTKAEAQMAGNDSAPIQDFYSLGCVLQETAAHLVLRNDRILVLRNDRKEAELLPESNKTAGIGLSETGLLLQCPEMPLAIIKGSQTEMSHGCICVRFRDYKGVRWLFKALRAIDQNTKEQDKSAEWLRKSFEKHREDILNTREKLKPAAMNAGEAAIRRHQAKCFSSPDREEIQYEAPEDENPPTRPSGVSRQSDDSLPALLSRQARIMDSSTGFSPEQPRRSTRQTRPVPGRPKSTTPEKWTQKHKLAPWPHSVVYPPQGIRRVTVDFNDLERLDEGEFLNDNIISFALRHIEEKMAPQYREQVHFFNSFFYTSLSTKSGKKTLNYDAVKRWTKNIDLFDKSFIVVPINLDLHWFVAIICNLNNLSRKQAGVDDEEDQNLIMLANDGKDDAMGSDRTEGRLEIVEDGTQVSLDDTHVDIADDKGSESRSKFFDGSKDSKKKRRTSLRRYDKSAPVIMTLDSFGVSRPAEVRYLKDYLKAEALDKRAMELDTSDLKGMTATGLPSQPNFCDCGVYLVGYIEEFAKDPRRFVDRILDREMEADTDFAHFDPDIKRAELRNALIAISAEQEEHLKEEKSRKKANKSQARTLTEQVATCNQAKATKASIQPSPSLPPRRAEHGHVRPKLVSATHETQPPTKQARDERTPTLPHETNPSDEEMEMEAPRALGQTAPSTGRTVLQETSDSAGSPQNSSSADGDELLDRTPAEDERNNLPRQGGMGRPSLLSDKPAAVPTRGRDHLRATRGIDTPGQSASEGLVIIDIGDEQDEVPDSQSQRQTELSF